MTERETAARSREVVCEFEAKLREAGMASARAEAEWLVADTLGVSRTDLSLWDGPLSSAQAAELEARLSRRLAGEPLQYVSGYEEFCGHRLTVTPAVLIPRPETEALLERAIAWLEAAGRRGCMAPRVLDLGTGSGNLAIGLAHAVRPCVVVAVELSWEALQVARINVRRHRLDDRIVLVQGDWTSGLAGAGEFDLIVSNPPYVATEAVDRLSGEVRRQPRMSLDGGPDGMAFHHRLLDDAPRLLRPGGAVWMECAEDQADVLRQAVSRQAWVRRARIFEDLAGRPRGLCVENR